MTLTKKILTVCTVSLILVAASATAFASPSYKTPAEVVAGITGRPVESVIEEKKEQNKSYGTIASEAGKLDEFKEEMLEVKKENLAAKVEEGVITQEQADAATQKLEQNQAVCDGTGNAGICQSTGTNQGSCSVNQGNCTNQGNCDASQGQGRHHGRN